MSEPTGSAALPSAADVMRRFLATLRRTQSMPPEQMRLYQRGLLRLLRHAREHVAYRDSGRLDPLFRHDGAIDWDRWAEVELPTAKRGKNAALCSDNATQDLARAGMGAARRALRRP